MRDGGRVRIWGYGIGCSLRGECDLIIGGVRWNAGFGPAALQASGP
jgi:hypothetical protein